MMIKNMKKELLQLRLAADLMQVEYCTDEENEQYAAMLAANESLPSNVHKCKSDLPESAQTAPEFFKIYAADFDEEEEQKYIQLETLANIKEIRAHIRVTREYVKTIKNCVVFFTVLTVIPLLVGAIYLIYLMSL